MQLPKWGKYIFYGLILINVIPVFCFQYFPTMDGAAHLYNVQLIRELLEGNGFISDYFKLQNSIVPNWMGHFFLLLYGFVFSPNWAEKLMLITYFIGLPLTFRYFINQITSIYNKPLNQSLAVYLIFPLTYSMTLHYGFFNFSFGLVFLFWTLGYFFKSYGSMTNRKGLVFGVLLLMTYLSHFFVFGLLLIFLFIAFVVLYFGSHGKASFSSMIKAGLRYIVFALPALILCAMYLTVFSYGGKSNSEEIAILFHWLINARPLIYFEENEFSKIFFFVLVLWSLIVGLYLIKKRKLEIGGKLMILFWVIALLLYLLLPNESSSAGFISIRMATIFFLFWVGLLSVITINRYVTIGLIIIALFVHFKITDRFIKNGQEYSDLATEIVEVSKYLKNEPKILPINNTGDWVKAHFSNYLGINQAAVIMDNYEASNSYFPVRWKMFSVDRKVEDKMTPCFQNDSAILPYLAGYDHLFLLKGEGRIDACKDLLERLGWEVLYESNQIILWWRELN